jgi:integrase/recombinase XerD
VPAAKPLDASGRDGVVGLHARLADVSNVYETIVGRTGTAFGQPVNPHLFRDCAATSIAIEDPEHVRIASQILGHRSTATTERYYNQARIVDAARRYQDFLLALRHGTMREDPEPVENR